jgi:hypothetical protein
VADGVSFSSTTRPRWVGTVDAGASSQQASGSKRDSLSSMADASLVRDLKVTPPSAQHNLPLHELLRAPGRSSVDGLGRCRCSALAAVTAVGATTVTLWGCVSQGYGRGAGRAYPDFDRVFIEQMIPHQLIGVRMASIIQKGILDPELRGLYVAIRGRAQSGESDRMARWNRQWWQPTTSS